ncbi:MAG: class C sortase [Lachnospiraceae bacterium]
MLKKKPQVVIFLIFVLGIMILLYPVVSSFISRITSTVAVQSYQVNIKSIDTSVRDAMLSDARSYNAKFADGTRPDPFKNKNSREGMEYQALLSVDGIMGYLDIPSIQIYLPIYHGVSKETLQKGVGHLPESSLPVGGEGTHAVLSAHCGLPNARLFTDLDQMEVGDCFCIHVLEQTIAYKVDQIQVILPENIHVLDIVPLEDYVTLLTCTPYGINSHRLLVRGIRVPYISKVPKEQPLHPIKIPDKFQLVFGMWILTIPVLLVLLWRWRRKNN